MLSRLVFVVVVNRIIHWRSRLDFSGRLIVELKNVADMEARRPLRILIDPGSNRETSDKNDENQTIFFITEAASCDRVVAP